MSRGEHSGTGGLSCRTSTTKMLVAMILFFAFTEIPIGILTVLAGSFNFNSFWQMFYTDLGEVFDIMVVISSAVNPTLYWLFNPQYRSETIKMFSEHGLSRKSRNNSSETETMRVT